MFSTFVQLHYILSISSVYKAYSAKHFILPPAATCRQCSSEKMTACSQAKQVRYVCNTPMPFTDHCILMDTHK